MGNKIFLAHLLSADIHRNRPVAACGQALRGTGGCGLRPLRQLLARGLQHPLPQGQDEAGFFRQRNKFARGHQPALGVVPAHQGFNAHNLPGAAHLGLVIQGQLVLFNGLAQGLFQGQALQHLGLHLRVKKAHAVAPFGFGAVHGQIGVLH